MIQVIYGDICQASCDIIVNASNGIGYMGGKRGLRKKLRGLAEAIHFQTQGAVEKEARAICRAHSLLGYAPGSVFITGAATLPCRMILHAVTMRFPGTFSSMKTIRRLLPAIIDTARQCGASTVAIPMLGTGVGGLKADRVMALYREFLEPLHDVDFHIYVYRKT